MDNIAIARALHVLAVVIWIGGVSIVTSILIPAVIRGDFGRDRLHAFRAFERRFIWHARIAVIVVGLSGLYMTAQLDLWNRFCSLDFWWMHAMVCVWSLFAFILFIGEPLILHRYLAKWMATRPDATFARIQRVHWILLTLSLITIFGAVAGSHGALF